MIQQLMLGALACLGVARAAETVRSPDGKVVVAVELQEGRPSWSVAYDDREIIRDGLLGVETAPENFCGTYELVGTETTKGDTIWKPAWGFLSEVRDHYNELTLKLEETAAAPRCGRSPDRATPASAPRRTPRLQRGRGRARMRSRLSPASRT